MYVNKKPDTIVHVMGYNSKKFGTLERYILKLGNEASKNGYNIVVIYNSMPRSREFVKQLRLNGIHLYTVNALSVFSFFYVFYKVLKKHKPKIIHSHFQPLLPSFYGWLLGYKHRWNTIRLMLLDKNLKEVSYRSELKITTRVYRYLINIFTTQFFSVSGAVNSQYKKIYPKHSSKFEILYNGVELNPNMRKPAREKMGFKYDTVYICCIAFASRTKGVDILLDAFKILCNTTRKNVKLCLIGLDTRSEVTRQLLSKIKDYQLNDKVINYGIINNVPEVLPAMDIYVQPSRSESLSNAIIEAGLVNLPAIGSNVGGIPEVIVDKITGFLFEVGDHREMASKLNLLVEDENLRLKLGRHSKEHKTKNFLMHNKIEEIMKYYNSIIK